MEKLTSLDSGSIFQMFDLTITGSFNFPRKDVTFFEYQQIFPLGGFITVIFGKGFSSKLVNLEKSKWLYIAIDNANTVNVLIFCIPNFLTKWEQSDQGLHCLPFHCIFSETTA